MTADQPRVSVATASSPGAIGLVQILGPGAASLLRQLTRIDDWPAQRLRLADFAGIDQGLAVLLRDDWAQLMPHGGPQVMRKLLDRLIDLGAAYEPDPPARQSYPEADSDCEAEMLALLARAASPAAIDLLLAQPRLWRRWIGSPDEGAKVVIARSDRLDLLVEPPAVVVVGRPNVGKSTLTNRMLGRAASIVADLPGTTRDWVAGLAELGPPAAAVAVRWLDTPGLRESDDPIERRAIELARLALEQADVLIAMRDPQTPWPDADHLPRTPDVWIVNKIDDEQGDRGRGDRDAPLLASALNGHGLAELERLVVGRMGLEDPGCESLWAFSPTLRAALTESDRDSLRAYLGEPARPRGRP